MDADRRHVQAGRSAMIFYIPKTRAEAALIARWIGGRVREFAPAGADAAMATIKDGRIVGAVAYQNFRVVDVEMVAAGEPGWLNRAALHAYFAYPFVQLGCRRVSAICHRKNRRARAFVEKLGWRMEGVHRKAMADGGDAISYGMLREECRWLNERMRACDESLSRKHDCTDAQRGARLVAL